MRNELQLYIDNTNCPDSFFCVDMDVFKSNYREFITEFKKFYDDSIVAYSFKTNYIPDLCR